MTLFIDKHEIIQKQMYKQNINNFIDKIKIETISNITDNEFDYLNDRLANNPYYICILHRVSFTNEDKLIENICYAINELDEYLNNFFEYPDNRDYYIFEIVNNK